MPVHRANRPIWVPLACFKRKKNHQHPWPWAAASKGNELGKFEERARRFDRDEGNELEKNYLELMKETNLAQGFFQLCPVT